MSALWAILAFIVHDQRKALWRGTALSFIVLIMGAALLGLSGWFITAAAAAGLAGLGAVFDVFRPSAMVRFLALGRAAARYGERLLTHDATLRALETLRARVLIGLMAAPYHKMVRIRGAQALNRLTADIDALDSVPLRLVLPLLAGLATQITAFIALWALVAPSIALWVCAGYSLGTALIFWQIARKAAPMSRKAEAAAQAFRSRLIDLIRARNDLTVQGQLCAQADFVNQADERRYVMLRKQERAERLTDASLQLLTTGITGGALVIGLSLVQNGTLTAPFAALGFFIALALAETITPMRRAVTDWGRVVEAARRVSRELAPLDGITPPAAPHKGVPKSELLRLDEITLNPVRSNVALIKGLSLSLRPGETVALTGASGAGKSTVLLAIAGLHPVAAGQITIAGQPLQNIPEAALRDAVTLLPQRSALMNGTVAQALRLAAPNCDDDTLWAALQAVQLAQVVKDRGGLATEIGPRGAGLSGGEARRLTLARALLRNPQVLLLDEPTEGLDAQTAEAVLQGIRTVLPQAAIVIAAHRDIETRFSDRVIEWG